MDEFLEMILFLFFICLLLGGPCVIVLVYEIKLGYKKAILSLLPIIIIISAFIYGSLRSSGRIIYATDEPGGILWATGYFSGILIVVAACSALAGMLIFFIGRYIKKKLKR